MCDLEVCAIMSHTKVILQEFNGPQNNFHTSTTLRHVSCDISFIQRWPVLDDYYCHLANMLAL